MLDCVDAHSLLSITLQFIYLVFLLKKKQKTVEQTSVPIIQQRGKSKFNLRKSNKNAKLHLLRFTKFT